MQKNKSLLQSHHTRTTLLPRLQNKVVIHDCSVGKTSNIIFLEERHRIAYNIVFQGTVNHKWQRGTLTTILKYQSNKKVTNNTPKVTYNRRTYKLNVTHYTCVNNIFMSLFIVSEVYVHVVLSPKRIIISIGTRTFRTSVGIEYSDECKSCLLALMFTWSCRPFFIQGHWMTFIQYICTKIAHVNPRTKLYRTHAPIYDTHTHIHILSVLLCYT